MIIKKTKVCYFGATPAYYFVPFLRVLMKAPGIDLTVIWGTDEAIRDYHEKEFNLQTKAPNDLLDGYKYYFLRNLFGKATYQKGFFGLNSLEVFRIFKQERFDYVIIHGWQYLINIFAILAALLCGSKILIRSETPLKQELKKNLVKLFLRKKVLTFFFKYVAGFLYIGDQNKAFYKYYGVPDKKLFFTPYSVNNNLLQSKKINGSSQKNLIRKTLGIAVDDIVIIFVGKLIFKKRPMTLLRALEKIKSEKVCAIFVGSGKLESELSEFVEARPALKVKFVGYKHQEDLPNFFSISDIFVLPSGEGETWGLVTNEALNFSLPVILSDMVGSSDDLAKKGNGFVFDLDNHDDLAEKLNFLIRDPSLRKSFGEKSYALTKIYSPEIVVEGILEAISKTS